MSASIGGFVPHCPVSAPVGFIVRRRKDAELESAIYRTCAGQGYGTEPASPVLPTARSVADSPTSLLTDEPDRESTRPMPTQLERDGKRSALPPTSG
ncbi:hypothetical protein Pve01_68000 [Planomonospora venezuelensis]|nr:hypothetical protein Pve01_68000 [Planomonospora venezuelensis]